LHFRCRRRRHGGRHRQEDTDRPEQERRRRVPSSAPSSSFGPARQTHHPGTGRYLAEYRPDAVTQEEPAAMITLTICRPTSE
jgi:hypothetical protein